ncbi:MAG TPA: LamG domain-containing protein, partial [Gemmataceae bacterium]|nr:LamG domain-containing protein [Gemmataceae bacterium]
MTSAAKSVWVRFLELVAWRLRFTARMRRLHRRAVARARVYRLGLRSFEDRVAPATFQVTSTADSGAGSLRQALVDANAAPGRDDILFNIGAGGLQTITPLTALPTIIDPVAIDGTTQPGYAGYPLIEVRGDSAGAAADGLTVTAADSTVRGLAINRFAGSGVRISGAAATGNVVAGNYLGTDAAGTAAAGNGAHGVLVTDGASNNTVGGAAAADRNVISGNAGDGVRVTGSAGNTVSGNYIGANALGTGTPAPAGATSWWQAEGDAADVVGSNSGTLLNGATFAAGRNGQAFQFDGFDDRVTVPDSPQLNFANQLTFESWVYQTDASQSGNSWNSQVIVARMPGSLSAGYWFGLTGYPGGPGGKPSLSVVTTNNGWVNVTGPSAIPLNTWTHLAGTYDGTNLQMYVNGSQVASVPATGALVMPSRDLTIGNDPN